jgi:multiple sugar transport system substrate-binding protein
LKVLVVDQPQIAAAIGRLRGDWSELSAGGDLTVAEATASEFSAASDFEADVVIVPSRYLGALVEHRRARPLRASVLENNEVAFDQILEAVREGELAFGGQYYAVPFGSRVPVLAAAAPPGEDLAPGGDDLSSRSATLQKRVLTTLAELDAAQFGAAIAFLAQSAPKARHPNRVAVLFDHESMTPRINSPPFVRGLKDLLGVLPDGGEAAAPGKPTGWTWWPPETGSDLSDHPSASSVSIPSSDEVFNPDTQAWETPRDGIARATLLGANGYVGLVTASSRNAPAAFRSLGWLAGRSGGGGRVRIAPYRAGEADELLESVLSHRGGVQIPRILAIDEYLAALDDSVRQALRGELQPDEALAEAARKWEEITERVGRERQRAVLQKHLNLDGSR